jgi:hypothetical protein
MLSEKYKPVLRIRIRSDLSHFPGSGSETSLWDSTYCRGVPYLNLFNMETLHKYCTTLDGTYKNMSQPNTSDLKIRYN